MQKSKELQESLDAPPETRVVQPTASGTDRFLECAYPWGKIVALEGKVDAPARFGSACHEGLALLLSKTSKGKTNYNKLAKKYGADISAKAVEERVHAAFPILTVWLGGDNPWGINFTKWELKIEASLAYDIEASTARWCKPPDERHVYTDRRPNELPGTADVLGAGAYRNNGRTISYAGKKPNFVLILDHKTGWEVGSPRESGQLRSLALAACRLHDIDRAIVAFMHAPENMAPTIYADTLDSDDLMKHIEDLRHANFRAGDGSMKPGVWCKWCPAFSICPTNATALIELRGNTPLATAEDVGAAHQRLGEFRRRFVDINDVIDAEIRAWIAKNGDALRPDGREVGFVERDYTNLSQASIVRALGKLEGGKLIQRLKKLGCIEHGKRRELRVK